MFDSHDDGRYIRLPNAKRRKINLLVDQLTVKNFRSLKYKLTKQLTQLGSGEWVYPALEALERCTCQHNYLHENRMHWSDAIYRLYCGCYLQAIQVHLGYKRVSGKPEKKEMQTHEELLRTNQSAVKCVRFTQFIQLADENSFQRVADETNVQWIKRVN